MGGYIAARDSALWDLEFADDPQGAFLPRGRPAAERTSAEKWLAGVALRTRCASS